MTETSTIPYDGMRNSDGKIRAEIRALTAQTTRIADLLELLIN